MSLRDQIAALYDGQKFAALMDKVAGDPAEIRRIATRWTTAGKGIVGNTDVLAGAVGRMDDWWKGESADAFVTYMARYSKAGQGMNDALVSCAGSLNDAADALAKARKGVDQLGESLITDVDNLRRVYAKDPDATEADLNAAISKRVGTAATAAQSYVDTAADALATSVKGISKRFGEEKTLFSDIPPAGDQTFVPGPGNKIEWIAVTPTEQRQTQLSGNANGTGGPTAAPVNNSNPGTSSAGNTPRPKAEVVDWIKEALTVIKSPEMASILRKRGIDVSDLDPDDPKDIERIWTVIHHESGGNPSARNDWDINAKNGVPSQGLMQTIPPTFDAHKLPGYGKILEPVDNIIAGVLYTYDRYGDLSGHPGIASLERGGGYKPY
ncbi:transglycosylase SLT domain-containing protein [Nonomuraea cavernae]|uniref:Transglycosylase n=1 Tax=Nonomuraea cavernae TaxID=2045107 RepID=A0A917ZIY1_9ACTN|nr:transglycosylase SLT domain-containing protein [Nonomuraea cavernae]MCA2190066.1 transglycosylase SLT domain-containing protein [Nonomuraea cavernae]GGO82984.1 transglycosylase [Nonomuraea cavernae]